jgi:hypothetical protein
MPDFPVDGFKTLVADFLSGRRSWDDVHSFVIDAEWTGATQLPRDSQSALEELRMAFLADSKDDPQFLLSRSEVQDLFGKL